MIDLWGARLLRAAENEGGSGGGDGAPDTGAPETDRTSQLEARLARMGQTLETLVTTNRQRDAQQVEAQTGEIERRLDAAVTKAGGEVDTAEKALAAALEDGDAPAVAKAQRVLAETAAKRERLMSEVDQARARLKERKEQPQGKPDAKLDTSNLDAWKGKHKTWYGIDTDLTQAAHEIDRTIRTAGVLTPGSPAYFEAIDRQMAAKYPDRFGGSPSGTPGGGGAVQQKPGGGGTKRIPAEIVEGWSRMGFDTSDPKRIESLLAARQKAADKGLLPQQMPASMGRVFTR